MGDDTGDSNTSVCLFDEKMRTDDRGVARHPWCLGVNAWPSTGKKGVILVFNPTFQLDGQALMVKRWWSSVDGQALMVNAWWSSVDGQALMVNAWWSTLDDQALMVKRWWSSVDRQALMVNATSDKKLTWWAWGKRMEWSEEEKRRRWWSVCFLFGFLSVVYYPFVVCLNSCWLQCPQFRAEKKWRRTLAR